MTDLMSNAEMRRRTLAFMAQHDTPGAHAWPNPARDIELLDQDGPDGTLTFACRTTPEMANVIGIVHGGITAALVDTCMGITCGCQAGCVTPTISMTVNYARPIPLDALVHVQAHIARCGATSGQMWAEVYPAGDPQAVYATATGVYSTKH